MDKKYKISKISDYDLWNKFEVNSPQSSIYSSIESIQTFKKNLDLFSISKGEEIKCIIYLYVEEKKIITSTPLIYSGILFEPQKKQKKSRYLLEKFKLTEIFINEILNQYKAIDINLHYNVEDIRPFLWFNYHEPNKPKFKTEVKYTSLINLKNKSLEDLFKDLDDVKQRDIRKVIKDNNYKINYDFDLDILKKLYIKTMKKNNPNFSDKNFDKILSFLEKIFLSKKAFQTNLFFENKIIYCNFFSYYNNIACYLFGAGDVDVKERLGGTYSLWKSIEKCHSKKVSCIDLEGVNSPQRGSFKINFGGDLSNYYKIMLKNYKVMN